MFGRKMFGRKMFGRKMFGRKMFGRKMFGRKMFGRKMCCRSSMPECWGLVPYGVGGSGIDRVLIIWESADHLGEC